MPSPTKCLRLQIHISEKSSCPQNLCLQFWGRKWLRKFLGAWKKCVLSAGKPMSIKFLVLVGGGYFGFWGRGGKCRFYFYGHEGFSEHLLEAQTGSGLSEVGFATTMLPVLRVLALQNTILRSNVPKACQHCPLVWFLGALELAVYARECAACVCCCEPRLYKTPLSASQT